MCVVVWRRPSGIDAGGIVTRMGRDAGTAARSRGQPSASAIEPDRPRTFGRGRARPCRRCRYAERRHHRCQLASSIITYGFVFWRRRRQLFILFHKMASVAACIRASQAWRLSAALGSARRPEEDGTPDETLRSDGAEVAAVEACWMLAREERALPLAASGSHARSASGVHCCRCEGRAPRAGDGRKCEARTDRRDRPQRRKRASGDRRCAGDRLCDG